MTYRWITRDGAYVNLPVIDATEPLKLVVEGCDIKGAVPQNPHQCAGARAAMRQEHRGFADFRRSRVYLLSKNGKALIRYGVDRTFRDATVVFDVANYFKPGQTFIFPVLKPSARTTGQRQGGPDRPRTGKTRASRRILEGLRPAG